MAAIDPPDAVGLRACRGMERTWAGSTFRVLECQTHAGAVWRAPDDASALLSFMLDEHGGPATCRLDRSVALRQPHVPRRITFLPAGVPGWTATEQAGQFRLAGLAFDPAMLLGELAELRNADPLQEPLVGLADQRIWELGRALSVECCEPDLFSLLHCQSLAVSLLIELLRLRSRRAAAPRARVGGLSKRHLTRITECIRENLARRVTLNELAELTGLSQSHVCSAFKQSTGLPPHRWQLRARIERAGELMQNPKTPLSRIALECGFNDQAHFTRVFRRVRGTTPSAWRKQLA